MIVLVKGIRCKLYADLTKTHHLSTLCQLVSNFLLVMYFVLNFLHKVLVLAMKNLLSIR